MIKRIPAALAAGQQPDYLILTLKRYRDGSSLRTDPLMAANTRTMTDADIAALRPMFRP